MTPQAVVALGIGQLVNWGVLYYAFAVLLQPVQAELGVAAWAVTGAFSLALIVAAAMAPAVGRWGDRGHAGRTIRLGGFAGAGLLGVWAAVPGTAVLYLAWAGLGACMATALYEPAFALITRAHDRPDARLRALAIVTLFGGLASTVFLPLAALLVNAFGWRTATGVLAVIMAVSTALTAPGDSAAPAPPIDHAAAAAPAPAHPGAAGVGFFMGLFGMASLASSAFIANLVPALAERGLTPTTAALLGGLFGVMQLPGRALMVSQRLMLSAPALLAVSLALQAVGLVLVAAVPSTPAVVAGVMTFAAGSGLTALARPFLVQSAFAIAQAGYVNGRLAQAQQLTRAAGPVAAASLAAMAGYGAVLAGMAALLCGLAVMAARRPQRARTNTPS